MATITTRSGKGSALTFTEMDDNFTNLNTDKLETAGGTLTGNLTMAAGKTITIGNEYTFPTTDGSINQVLTTDGSGNLSFAAVSALQIVSNSVGNDEIINTDDFTVNSLTTTAGITVGDHILPTSNNAVDLGSTTRMFRELYLGPDSLYVNGVKVLSSNAATMQFTTDASSNQEIFFSPDGDFRMASTQGDVIVNTGNTLKVDTIEGVGQASIPNTIQAAGFQSGDISLTASKISKTAGNMEIETATGGSEYIHLETNDVYLGTFASAVRISDGTVTTASGDMNLKSVDGNVAISAEGTDKDVIIKAKDAGGTLNTHSTFFNNARVQKTTPGGGTTETLYDQVIDTGSIRIGSTADNFSNTGDAPDTQSNYPFTGIIVSNGTKKTWPQIAITSHGGDNPLYNRFGSPSHIEYPNALVNFKASRGTEGSETAIQSGDNIGSFQFNAHDGNDFGGSSQRSSASIEVKANENHSSSNDRGAKVTFNVMPTGGDGSKASRDTVIEAEGDGVKLGNLTDSKYLDVDVANSQLVLNTTNKITTGTDEHLTLEPNGTGELRINTDVAEHYNANGWIIHNNAQGGFTDLTGTYASTFGGMYGTGIDIQATNDYAGLNLWSHKSNSKYPNLWAHRSRESGGNKDFLNNGDRIFNFLGSGYDGTDTEANAYGVYAPVGELILVANEDHSASARGGKWQFRTTSTGATSGSTKMEVGDNIEANAPFILQSVTETERDALTAVTGMMIFNTTDSRAQVYNGTSWQSLH